MQTRILLSIKPEFVALIFEKKKGYEFRRAIFKSESVKKVVIYSSSPVQKVVGEFEIEQVLSKSVKKLWRETKGFAGVGKEYYDSYFAGKDMGHAIKIKPKSVEEYKIAKCLKKDFGIAHPPQSFRYL